MALDSEVNEKLSKMQKAIREFKKVSDRYCDAVYLRRFDIEDIDDLLREMDKTCALEKHPYLNKLFYDGKQKGPKEIIELKQSTHGVWDKCKVDIVNELKRIGYSERKAFATTGRLIKTYYQEYYTHDSPDLVRQTYKYHQKNKK